MVGQHGKEAMVDIAERVSQYSVNTNNSVHSVHRDVRLDRIPQGGDDQPVGRFLLEGTC